SGPQFGLGKHEIAVWKGYGQNRFEPRRDGHSRFVSPLKRSLSKPQYGFGTVRTEQLHRFVRYFPDDSSEAEVIPSAASITCSSDDSAFHLFNSVTASSTVDSILFPWKADLLMTNAPPNRAGRR